MYYYIVYNYTTSTGSLFSGTKIIDLTRGALNHFNWIETFHDTTGERMLEKGLEWTNHFDYIGNIDNLIVYQSREIGS